MYSTLALNNSKRSGNIVGTHQKLDKIARKILQKSLPARVYFPDIKEILLFEGMGGPDGLKRKSPGVDEPMHFIIPGQDDGKLIQMILDHQYNLRKALATDSKHVAFEYGVAITMTALPERVVTPKLEKKELKNVDLKQAFYRSLERVASLNMYTRFLEQGWNTDLAFETKNILLPEIARAIALCWASSIPELTDPAK